MNTYVAAAPSAGSDGGSPPTKAVVVVTDAFGVSLINNQLLAGQDPPNLMSCPNSVRIHTVCSCLRLQAAQEMLVWHLRRRFCSRG